MMAVAHMRLHGSVADHQVAFRTFAAAVTFFGAGDRVRVVTGTVTPIDLMQWGSLGR